VSLPVVAVTDTKVFLRRALGAAWRRVRAVSPGPIEIGPPICQLFIGGYGKRTVYTFVNFPSLFSPTTASACSYRLTLYDQGGNKVGSRRIGVPALGTVEVRVEDIFDLPLPEIGLVSAQITSGCPVLRSSPPRPHQGAFLCDVSRRRHAIDRDRSSTIGDVGTLPGPRIVAL
jgi:hypothetical protein